MTRAMILAAGRGERLRPLTDTCPKPLVKVAGKPLIVRHLENLKEAGITDIVINLAYLGEKIEAYLGNGSHWGVSIAYSRETQPLEVGGGIFNALPLLGEEPFILVNGDIWTDYPFAVLKNKTKSKALAHLVLVENPQHNPRGDFSLLASGHLSRDTTLATYTYSGMAVLHPHLFQGCHPGAFRLIPLVDQILPQQLASGEIYEGAWTDVGTLERLQTLEESLAKMSV